MESTKKQSWKSFFKLIFKSKLPWHLYILAFLASIFGTKLGLELPMIMGEIYAGNIFDKSIVIKLIYMTILSIIGYSSASFFYSLASAKTPRNIRHNLWAKLIRIPMSYYNKQEGLSLVSRVTSDPAFINGIVQDTFSIVNTTYSFVGSIIIMYGMNVKLTWALLPIIPYILIVTFGVGHFAQKAQQKIQNKYSGLTAYFAERLPKIRLIKMFNKEEVEMDHANKIITEQYKAERYKSIVELFSEPLMQSVQAITTGIVLIYGAVMVSTGEIDTGQLIAFYMYIVNIHNGVVRYGQYIQSVKVGKGASEKITEIINTNDEIVRREVSLEDILKNSNGNIRLENISFAYDDKKVLNNIDIIIPERKVTAIVGPSGGGKTTVLNLLERFYEPNEGRILIGNTPAEKVHLDEWRGSFAYVSQNSPLLSGSIRDNIIYGVKRNVSDEEVREAAKLADALDFIEEFPDGFETEVGELAAKLSGGQRQRITLARAFITNPEYLLLDEATSSLDANSEIKVRKGIELLMEGRTTIVIAHNLATVRNADQIVVIDSGKVSGIGNHDELFKNNNLYRTLVDIQFEKEQKLGVI